MLRFGLITAAALLSAPFAQAGNQLFEASWSVKAFGNERTGGSGESAVYSAWGIPLGIQCNPNQPRCPFESTPTDGSGNFDPLGGHQSYALFCAPWSDWQGMGTTQRPAKGGTSLDGSYNPIPPIYRNPVFFTSGGEPNTISCTATTTDGQGGAGPAMLGEPITGTWAAFTTGTAKGGFTFRAAPPNHKAGVRTTGQIGEFNNLYPYIYRYTYATLRNDAGIFGPGGGPGSFDISYVVGTKRVGRVAVKQGSARFGGTMRMLGRLTSWICYYRDGSCLIDAPNWRYDAIGASAYTSGGVVTRGYLATWAYYYTFCPGYPFCPPIYVVGYRFPWTTGSVTVTAVGRGPQKTVHYERGYDNRNTTTPSGKGAIQLVTPVVTRWRHTTATFETAGIGILKIEFLPEPHALSMLIAGIGFLVVARRSMPH